MPVGLPWSRLVREGAPSGFSAVLINPSHSFSDLALFVRKDEERLLAAIDGTRSVGEILRGADGAISAEDGRTFFRRLWEYDQIVLDRKHAGRV